MLNRIRRRWPLLVIILIVLAAGGYFVLRYFGSGSNSNDVIERWFNDPASRPGLTTNMDRNACPDAPFILFATARSAGWAAHAIEQLQTGRLIRPRARYVGEAPPS